MASFRNEWYGEIWVNGRKIRDCAGHPERWTTVELPLEAGDNEVVFRTSPGRNPVWVTSLAFMLVPRVTRTEDWRRGSEADVENPDGLIVSARP